MLIQFHFLDGYGQVGLDNAGCVEIYIECNDRTREYFEQEISKGVPVLSKFNHKGIPGKKRTYREIKNDDDIKAILNYLKEKKPRLEIEIEGDETDEPPQRRYTFKKWNGKYGADARFIVRDNWTEMQSIFTPGRCQDLVWTYTDLASDKSISTWDEFGEESVDDLEPIAF